MKIDQLLELYMKDRKRLLALPFFSQCAESEKNATSAMQTQTGALKPKPILVDKQSSEPSSPVAKNSKEPPTVSVTRRPMHRGFSDLGNRIKKRVTLRYLPIIPYEVHQVMQMFSSSISSHYVCPSDSSPYEGEVVIVVPALDPPPQAPPASGGGPSVQIVETQVQEKDLGSPKTTTESSGKWVSVSATRGLSCVVLQRLTMVIHRLRPCSDRAGKSSEFYLCRTGWHLIMYFCVF